MTPPLGNTATLEVTTPGLAYTLHGTQGAFNSSAVRDQLYSAIDAGEGEFMLCLSQAQLCDGTLLGVLTGAYLYATTRGRPMVLTGLSDQMTGVLSTFRGGRTLLTSAR